LVEDRLSADRHQFLRVACRGAIAELFIHGASLGMFHVEDVSDGGIFLACPNPVVPLHAKVEVAIVDSNPPARSAAEVVNVVRPGSSRPPGYALQLAAIPNDMVEAVASKSQPTLPSPGRPDVGEVADARVLIALRSASLRAALCDGLHAFNVRATQAAPDALQDAVAKGIRVALIEIASVDDGIALLKVLHGAEPRARALLFSQKLPDTNGRRALQQAGVDQLVLPPLDPFDVLKRLFTKGGGDLSRLR
jgi:hypothetical protein